MKGFKMDEDEIYDMLSQLKADIEEFIGEFDGDIYIDLDIYYSVVIALDNKKYVCSIFEQSQFDIDEFKIEDELVYEIYIKFKNGE